MSYQLKKEGGGGMDRGKVGLGKDPKKGAAGAKSKPLSSLPPLAGYSSEACAFLKPVTGAFLGFGAAQIGLAAVKQTPPPSPGEV